MLSIKKINKSFNKGTDVEKTIFQGFDLDIEDNTSTAIIGTNGCGKSTLLNIIAGSLSVDGGKIEVDGKDITRYSEKKRAKFFGRVHQNPSKGVSPSLTILENLALADNKNKSFNLSPLVNKGRLDYYRSLLEPLHLGLENMLDTKVSLLSGGQRQSLSLVMASMNDPRLLLLDEHTASLDPRTSRVVMEKTKELISNKKMTTLIITHNMQDAVNYSDRVIMIKEGEIFLDRKSREIGVEDLNHLYRMEEME